jgi:hypothetical protein
VLLGDLLHPRAIFDRIAERVLGEYDVAERPALVGLARADQLDGPIDQVDEEPRDARDGAAGLRVVEDTCVLDWARRWARPPWRLSNGHRRMLRLVLADCR